MDVNKNTFKFTYSGEKKQKINEILEKYIPKEENLYEQICQLDKQAEKKATILSLVLGVVSLLVLGTGFTLILKTAFFFLGMIVGIIGLAGIGLSYPFYAHISTRDREKYAPKIIELSKKLKRQNQEEV